MTQRERGYYWATNDEDPEPQPVYVDYDGRIWMIGGPCPVQEGWKILQPLQEVSK